MTACSARTSFPGTRKAAGSSSIHLLTEPREKAHLVPRDRVMRERLDNPENQVGKAFIAAFNPPSLGGGLFALIADRLAGKPTLAFEESYTNKLREAARKAVAEVYEPHLRGELLVEQGQEIGEEQLLLLREEHDVANKAMPLSARGRRVGSVLVLAAAMFALIGYYIHRHEPEIAGDLRQDRLDLFALGARAGAGQAARPTPLERRALPDRDRGHDPGDRL